MYLKKFLLLLYYPKFREVYKISVTDLLGKRFDRLVVIERAENTKQGDAQWLCRCDCGNEKIIRANALKTGRTRSCGCLLSECSKKRMAKLMTKHGKSNSRLYRVWASMKERCSSANNKGYDNYGGRGISVCDKWQEFEPFYKWAIANGYKKRLEIDRIDNDGNYEPDNCRWVTSKQNCRNTRKNIKVEVTNRATGNKQQFDSVSEVCEVLKLPSYSSVIRAVHGKKTKYCKMYEFKIID